MKHGILVYHRKEGHYLSDCALECLLLARVQSEPIRFVCNEVELTVTSTMTVDEILTAWHIDVERRRTLDEIEAKLLGGTR